MRCTESSETSDRPVTLLAHASCYNSKKMRCDMMVQTLLCNDLLWPSSTPAFGTWSYCEVAELLAAATAFVLNSCCSCDIPGHSATSLSRGGEFEPSWREAQIGPRSSSDRARLHGSGSKTPWPCSHGETAQCHAKRRHLRYAMTSRPTQTVREHESE